jgi:two-component system, cell cycle sensor histidine kinase and response regulator CckA
VFLDDSGKSVRRAGVNLDITERKRDEAALRESEERFRNMADTAPVMIWVTGPDKLFTFVNKTWLDFTGRTMEEELGNGWAAGVHPDDLQRCYEAYCSAFDARRNFQLECRLRRKDGEYRSILCSGVPRFAPGGIFAGYIGSDIDITDLQSEERFRQLAENIDQVFWMLDLGTQQILYVSPGFEKVWGCSSADLYQNRDRLVESVHAEDRDRFTAFLTKVKSEPAEESYRIVRPDGSVRWIHDRSFLVYDPEGKPYRVGGIAEDVTAHRELEEQLRQAHKMEAVGRLAGGIAHDFNNLLTIIAGYSKMLLDGTATTDPRREGLEQILNAGNRASILTRQLLAFSRRQVLQPKVVNLNHLLTNVRALLRPLVGEHITIETELDPEVSCIKVDPQQIEQVVMNLAANARDAMANGGQFRIQTSMANPSEHQAENIPCRVGKWVRLRISDTGCGMDDRTRERAFEPFFTTKGLGKGTGLGLSTVYGIVRQNQGEIHVSSELGRGTVFDLYFPAVSESEAESEVPANEHPKTATTETILVAEDEPSVRGLVKQTLEKLGYTVLEAMDGYEALRVIEQHESEIHLVLTDVIMPLMNGHELATRLHSIRPGTKILYMSGYADEVLAFHGIARPELAFIQKPFTPSELAGKVETVLSAN